MIIHHTYPFTSLSDDAKARYCTLLQRFPDLEHEPFFPVSALPALLEELQKSLAIPRASYRDEISRARMNAYAGACAESVAGLVQRWISTSPSELGKEEGETLVAVCPRWLDNEMRRLYQVRHEYPWARLRALTDEVIRFHCKQWISTSLPTEESLCPQTPNLLASYNEALALHPGHWFRKSIFAHLNTGFHTAVSSYYKLLSGHVHALWRVDPSHKALHASSATHEEFAATLRLSRYIASCHLLILHSSDGILWDSAGARPAEHIHLRGDTLCIEQEQVLCLLRRALMHYAKMPEEPRLGCPALRSWTPGRPRLIPFVEQWITRTFFRFYLPVLAP